MINYPVRLNDNFEIVDCYGDIVVPDITVFKYRQSGLHNRDHTHIERQKAIGEYIVNLINSDYESKQNGHQKVEVHEVAKVIKKRPGNPWGRSGKPKE